MSVGLDYNFLKDAAQENCLGGARGKYMRLVSKRAHDSTAPRMSLKRKRSAGQEGERAEAEDMADMVPAEGRNSTGVFPGLQPGT